MRVDRRSMFGRIAAGLAGLFVGGAAAAMRPESRADSLAAESRAIIGGDSITDIERISGRYRARQQVELNIQREKLMAEIVDPRTKDHEAATKALVELHRREAELWGFDVEKEPDYELVLSGSA